MHQLPSAVTVVLVKLAAVGAVLIALRVAWEAVEYFATKAQHHSIRSRLKALKGRQRMAAVVLFSIIWALIGAVVWRWAASGPKAIPPEGTAGNPTVSPQPVANPDTAAAKPAVAVAADGPYILVRNTGAPAMFRARLVATHAQEFPSVTAGSRFEGIWETTLTDKTEIATGDADRLMLGAVVGDNEPHVARFHFYDVAAQKMGVREARELPDRGVPALSLDLTLVSVPAIAGGPKTYEFIVVQGRVEFLGLKPF